MRIAYLCKRQYMGHDVIVDRYARLYEQPYQLARLGHDVLGLCLSYRPIDERDEVHEASPGSLHWLGMAPGAIRCRLLTYPFRALQVLHDFKPDIIVGASDALHIILGQWLAQFLGVHFAADLYDHFESFGLSRLPGVVPLFRRALRHAFVVGCVSEPLAELIQSLCNADCKVLTLPSTIDSSMFYPRDSQACRLQFGLPQHAKLIGTAGGLSKEKGIKPLYRAFEALVNEDPQLHLVLAGTLDQQCLPPSHPRVHYLGQLAHAEIAELFCALDVGVVYIRDTPYGRYSFPQKAYEMAACGIPMVVAKVGAMKNLFSDTPQLLYRADCVYDLKSCIREQLIKATVVNLQLKDWAQLGREFETALTKLLHQ